MGDGNRILATFEVDAQEQTAKPCSLRTYESSGCPPSLLALAGNTVHQDQALPVATHAVDATDPWAIHQSYLER